MFNPQYFPILLIKQVNELLTQMLYPMSCQLCPTNLDGQAQILQIPRGNTTTKLGSPTAEAWADHQGPSHSRMGNLQWI
jgi:hypothetical protein